MLGISGSGPQAVALQADLGQLEDRLWDAADEMRANSGLKASEYGTPVLGLIFLRFADAKFQKARASIEAKASPRRKVGPSDYLAQGVIYLTETARFAHLLDLPAAAGLGGFQACSAGQCSDVRVLDEACAAARGRPDSRA